MTNEIVNSATGLLLAFEVDRMADLRYDKSEKRENGKRWEPYKDLEYRMALSKFSFEVVSLHETPPLKGLKLGKRVADLGLWPGQRTLEALELQQHLIPEKLRGHVTFLGPGFTWKYDQKSYMAELFYAAGSWRMRWRLFSQEVGPTDLFLKPKEG